VFQVFLLLILSNVDPTTISPHAYPSDPNREAGESGRAFYLNSFEHYPSSRPPWGGQNNIMWIVLTTDWPHSGEKILYGASQDQLSEAWVVSERFFIDEDVEYISIKMQVRFINGINTWQVVPQGPVFVMARFIVNPDGSISVYDADSGDSPTPTGFFVDLELVGLPWEELEFKLNRRANRYRIYYNRELIHTGTPFTTDVQDLALAQTTRSASVGMHLDTIEVTEDLASVPTLSHWGLLLLCSGLAASALVIRRNRTEPA
jgi:hypothetical protein